MSSISTPYYKILDFMLIFLACSLAYWVRFDTFSLPLYYFLPTAILALVSTISLGISNFYHTTNSESSPQQAIAAIGGLTAAAILTIAFLYLTKTGENYSRIWFVTSVIFSFISLITARYILGKIFNISTSPRVIVILGGNETADRIQDTLKSIHNEGILIAERFKSSNGADLDMAKVARYIEKYRQKSDLKNVVTEVWVTHDIFSRYSHAELTLAFDSCSVAIVYVPEFPEFSLSNKEQVQMIAGVPTINSNFSKNQKLGQLLKFIEDQAIAWSAIVLLSPVLILIAISIKLDSRGPVFYKQLRYGFGGKDFLIWKFRTMYVTESDTEFKQAQKDDPRITKVGKFLRRTSLDELPQLFNVINGSMSLVGPRPHPAKLNEQYREDIKQYMYRHASKPGITGLAQVNGFRGETPTIDLMEKRVRLDLEYVQNWSVLLDLKILVATVGHVLFNTTAR